MASNADDICVVYCISDATCSDPHPHGYIGLTKNQARRERDYRRSGKWPSDGHVSNAPKSRNFLITSSEHARPVGSKILPPAW